MSESIQRARIGGIEIGPGRSLALIAGPCVIESAEHTLFLARALRDVCASSGVPLVFKASFDKANRSSIRSFRGPGLEEGLRILRRVRDDVGVPVLSDIHTPEQAEPAGQALDCLQIPAFLCRQTDLLAAAATTAATAGKCVNVKKGQFVSPEEMRNVVEKLAEGGCRNVLLTERGTFFGYHRLVNDMTAVPKMRKFAPVVFDATHSCQFPGAAGHQSGGQREFAGTLALAGTAAGADALFVEVHDAPDRAKSDPATVYPLADFPALLEAVVRVSRAVRA
ncbi:MAG: 3-deoxy-8-phosphooctulonate synthase [Phycisphaerae bacterium]|nr:MAG: 3-deoxy-8-phosphooctulonate synthase [Planctomycetota bacterium]KAB2947218.1 MAG: 3-deoxy-8-phosphooctulonate synthase [Phycisphaerae bacterium]MBE7458086.1 3-deoxy-8-phosphooctulonate synthase [Planctomycetia bacterium]MCK6464449.1 3-deoxy-8-phosphooctulonate synthase [Phycisphaerae bacterium]MCL4718000.1 3-deoxy-8-phosphooctulonate synthase [Phycisphaerae bacterium]